MTHWVKFHDHGGRVKWLRADAVVAVSEAKDARYPDGKWSDITIAGVKRPLTVRSSIVEVLAMLGAGGAVADDGGEP